MGEEGGGERRSKKGRREREREREKEREEHRLCQYPLTMVTEIIH